MEKTFERYYGEHYMMAIFSKGWVDYFFEPHRQDERRGSIPVGR